MVDLASAVIIPPSMAAPKPAKQSSRPKAKAKLPENHRLRPRELFFAFLGVATSSGLSVLWFRAVPEAMAHKGIDRSALDGVELVLTNLAVQIAILLVGMVVLAAGIATRTATGKERATWIMAAGSLVLFAALVASYYSLYEPVLSPDSADLAGDDWEDGEREPTQPGSQPSEPGGSGPSPSPSPSP